MCLNYVSLRAHSDHSLCCGLAKPEAMIEAARSLQIPAIALTDWASLAGWPRFSRTAFKLGIKPIAGVSLKLEVLEGIQGWVSLLARTERGYQALLDLVTQAWKCAPHSEASDQVQLPYESLRPALEDLILLSGGPESALDALLLSNGGGAAEARLEEWASNRLRDNVFVALSRTGGPGEAEAELRGVQGAEKYGFGIVAAPPIYFLEREQYEPHQVRVAIQRACSLSDPSLKHAFSPDACLVPAAEVVQRFSDLPEALENSVEIACRCTWRPSPFTYQLPCLVASGQDQGVLREQAQVGLAERLRLRPRVDTEATYQARLDYELSVINRMGFASYFLVVQEFIQWAKAQGIPVGPGRGSGVGSLVAYALGITDLDPIRFHLLFERFLNPARVSLPDFDIDFCPKGRDRVIEHVIERYGKERVAQIATFGTMRARAAIRDVGRALGHPYGFVDQLVRLVPFDLEITLKEALSASEGLREQYEGKEEVRVLIDLALDLEGTLRSVGKHAGGLIIAPKPLTHYTPLVWDAEGKHPLAQLDKDDLEALGLVKFDFLGLTTLTILHEATLEINRFREARGEPALQLSEIPLDDPKTFRCLKSAETTAVFQLEAGGARSLIHKLSPDCFEEIVALVALNRPGPLQSGMADSFVQRKHGQEDVAYPDPKWQHPVLEPILKETYGTILYQEQVIQIAQVLSGYSVAEADLLRRAIGKKKAEEMLRHRDGFVAGAEHRGVDRTLAEHIFDLVEKFSSYGFNKSHSAAYALIAYQTLYLKANYPDFFMVAVLTAESDQLEKLPLLLAEVRRMGLKVNPPDINFGEVGFKVRGRGVIEYGLSAIRGVGAKAAQRVVEERRSRGPFKSLEEFCLRCRVQEVPKAALEKLVWAGAFDRIGPSRERLFAQIPKCLKAAQQFAQAQASGQQSLFQGAALPGSEALVFQAREAQFATHAVESDRSLLTWDAWSRLDREGQVLGHYLSGHPLSLLAPELEFFGVTPGLRRPTQVEFRGRVQTAVLLQRIKVVRRQDASFCLLFCDGGELYLEAIWEGTLPEEKRKPLLAGAPLILSGDLYVSKITGKVRLQVASLETLGAFRARNARSMEAIVDEQAFASGAWGRAEWLNFKSALSASAPEAGVPFSFCIETVAGPIQWAIQGWKAHPDPFRFRETFKGPSLPGLKGWCVAYEGGSIQYTPLGLVEAGSPSRGRVAAKLVSSV